MGILALALASSVWSQPGINLPICSHDSTICDGSYSGTQLDLWNKGLTGGVPTQLGLLTDLTNLILDKNPLTGDVPTQLGLLTKLVYLWIIDTDLSGSVPSQLGLLTSLQSLQLQDNHFSGSLPSQLGNLNPTQWCDIGGTNSFDCPLPALVGKCSANLECVPNGPNKWCRKLKRLKQAKKHVKKREGNEGKWGEVLTG